MKLPSIKDIDVKGKRVLLRVDFNVPIDVNNGGVIESYRIDRAMPTINFLKEKGAKIIILSYLSDGDKSLKSVSDFIGKKYFDIRFCDLENASKNISDMDYGDVLLVENLHKNKDDKVEDKKNSVEFASRLAGLGDVFVNDAFGQCHREYASIVGIPKFLPSFAGLLLEEEVKKLSESFNSDHPFLLILGGVKFESKLGVLKKFINVADKIFVGGGLAHNFFRKMGSEIGASIFDDEVDISEYIGNPKIFLPIDVKKEGNSILDCGEKTIEALKEEIGKAKFILWNGPLGDFEKDGFGEGTASVARLISQSDAVSIIGGGDTISAINKNKIIFDKQKTFISTGGGAMLTFLADGTLPGIEALKK